MNSRRTYTMTTRARGVEETRRRILDAVVSLHAERLAADIALDDVAARARVSVQTVLRHFGSRAGLVEAAVPHAEREVRAERRVPVGDVDQAVAVVVDHYEQRGDGVLLMLAQEGHEPLMARVTGRGRQVHRDWVADVFAPYLPEPGEQRETLVDLLAVATDVYTWKQLRRDRGLGRAATEQRIRHLVGSLLTTAPGRRA